MIFSFAILLITSLTIFVSPATVNTKRASSTAVLSDVEELMADVLDFNTVVDKIPLTGSSFGNVITAVMNGLTVMATATQLTSDVENLAAPVDLADAETILEQITAIQGQVINAVTALQARKSTLESALTGVGFFILTNGKMRGDAMIQTLKNAAPPEINQETIADLQNGFDTALTAALETFPSCNPLISIGL